jgi:hypothetical protein
MLRRSATKIAVAALAAALFVVVGCGDDAEQETSDATLELPDEEHR